MCSLRRYISAYLNAEHGGANYFSRWKAINIRPESKAAAYGWVEHLPIGG